MTAASRLERYHAVLRGLAHRHRLRTLSLPKGFDFASNDYLALAGSKRLADAIVAALSRGTPVGASGSRLLRGDRPEHEAFEAAAAEFFHAESALFFGGGYVANFAVLTTLPQKGDLIILDELAHASVHEGARAGRAKIALAAHNRPEAVEDAIRAWRAEGGLGHPWIVAESLYSMDGDRAPLEELTAVAAQNDAFLFIDEAHATGVFGAEGRGLAENLEGQDNVVVLHTCGKALGGSGAFVTAPRILRDFMINRCRPFIYATAPSPLAAIAALEALSILREEPERRERLSRLVAFASEKIETRCGIKPSGSQILPVIIGDNSRAVALAEALQRRGFDIRAVRPPTVPEGTARLRISLTLNVNETIVSEMLDALAEERERLPS